MIFLGCGAIVVEAQTGALGHGGVCLVFGLVVGAMIFATGHICGAHFNPAVTLAFASTGAFPWREVPAYFVAQFVGSSLACGCLLVAVGSEANLGATTPDIGLASAVLVECLLSFFLMFVIKSVATDARVEGNVAALAIGGTIAACALMGGPLTGGSMNPVRSLGPAWVSGVWTAQWVYVLGPALGATVGAFAYDWLAYGSASGEAAGS
jgi:MIP family channel proteins